VRNVLRSPAGKWSHIPIERLRPPRRESWGPLELAVGLLGIVAVSVAGALLMRGCK
jgi:hypothetical protein